MKYLLQSKLYEIWTWTVTVAFASYDVVCQVGEGIFDDMMGSVGDHPEWLSWIIYICLAMLIISTAILNSTTKIAKAILKIKEILTELRK